MSEKFAPRKLCDEEASWLETLHLDRLGKQPDLAKEVRALREEIAMLRKEIAPVPSLILTGRDVVEAFDRLMEHAK